MASRNSTRSSTSRSSTDPQSGVDPQAASENARQQFALITQSAETLLRSAEVWQQAQLQFTQRTRSSYHDAAARISQVTHPAELISVQASLLMSSLQQIMQFNVDLMTGAMAQQSEAASAAPEAPAVSSAPTNVGLAAMAPMVQAWQSMFTAPLNGTGTPTAH